MHVLFHRSATYYDPSIIVITFQVYFNLCTSLYISGIMADHIGVLVGL